MIPQTLVPHSVGDHLYKRRDGGLFSTVGEIKKVYIFGYCEKKKCHYGSKLVETDFYLCKSYFERYFEQSVLALILNNDIFFTKK